MLQQPRGHGHIKFACEQCRFRKLKCNGTHPCQRCSKLKLECTFDRSRLTRAARGKRIEMLREGQNRLPSPQHTSPAGPDCDGRTASIEPQSLVDQQQRRHASSPWRTEVSANDGFASSFWTCRHGSDNAILAPSPLTDNSAGDVLSMAGYGFVPTSQDSKGNPGPRSSVTPPIPVVSSSDRGEQEHDANSTASSPDLEKQEKWKHVNSHVANAADLDVVHPPASSVPSGKGWLAGFREDEILHWVNIFLDRLHLTVPILDHWTLQRDLLLQRHHEDVDFAAMILSLCSFALVQPVYSVEYASMPFRKNLASKMLNTASMMRSSFSFGEKTTLEATATSFFMFGALYGLDMANAAWLRLRESVECGRLIGLNKPETYRALETHERIQRFRLFLVLSVTERGYGLSKSQIISFTGRHLQNFEQISGLVNPSTTINVSNIIIQDNHSSTSLRGLLQLMRLYDTIDEKVISCWNKDCSPSLKKCSYLTTERVCEIYHAIQGAIETTDQRPLGPTPAAQALPYLLGTFTFKPQITISQWADCFILQQFMLTRLWTSCLTHDLIDEMSEYSFMKPSFAIDIAENAVEECVGIGDAVLEIHGIGMIKRICDIAMGVVMSLQFLQDSEDRVVKQRGHLVLTGYFQLLCRLRNGSHPFSLVLQQAYDSVNEVHMA